MYSYSLPLAIHKYQAQQLFTGTQLLGADKVLVMDEQDTVLDILDRADAGENIQQLDGLLCPGFINAHCHLELSHMKGLIPEHTGLVNFVASVVQLRHFSEELIREAIDRQDSIMYDNGIVGVGDICNHAHTLHAKTKSKLRYHNFIEVSGWNPAIAQKRMDHSLGVYDSFRKLFPASTSMAPHAPYSVSDTLWALLKPYLAGAGITIHNQETAAENELFEQGTGEFLDLYQQMGIVNPDFKASGKHSLPTYFHHLQSAKRQLLVHNTFTSESDIQFLKEQAHPATYFCLCPTANWYIEQYLPPIDLFEREGLSLVLGTDSLASNHQLSIWEEVKMIHQHFPTLTLSTLLNWATLNGAHALGMEDRLGSFEKGKQPGMVLISGVEQDGSLNGSSAKRYR